MNIRIETAGRWSCNRDVTEPGCAKIYPNWNEPHGMRVMHLLGCWVELWTIHVTGIYYSDPFRPDQYPILGISQSDSEALHRWRPTSLREHTEVRLKRQRDELGWPR